MSISKEIFREYDIRGVYPIELDENAIELIGMAFGTLLHRRNLRNVVVGRDNRESSLSLSKSLIKGLVSTGCTVYDTDLTVQPAAHYYSFLDGIDASINITASHNPKEYNGVKLEFKNAEPCFGSELLDLYYMIVNGDFVTGEGSYFKKDYNSVYKQFISEKFKLNKKLKVVLYCGNGVTSIVYPEIVANIGAEVIPVRCSLDSQFPVGVPDPETGTFFPELKKAILENKADLGIGFDGDGDRLGVLDEKGNSYKADEFFLLYVKEVLKDNPGAKIIYDVKTSQVVEDLVRLWGGTPIMLRTGRAFFLKEMFHNGGVIGMEFAGHLYFNDKFPGFDDGVYASCRLLEILAGSDQPLSELMSQFPKTKTTPEITIPCPDTRKFQIVQDIVKRLSTAEHYLKVITIDGVRVSLTPTSWFLIRAKNTSPYLCIRMEGATDEELENLMAEVIKVLAIYKELNLADLNLK